MTKRRTAPDSEAIASGEARAMRLNDYLRRQAELCIAISRATFDLTMAGRLRDLAVGLQGKAAELEDEVGFPPHLISGNGASEDRRGRG